MPVRVSAADANQASRGADRHAVAHTARKYAGLTPLVVRLGEKINLIMPNLLATVPERSVGKVRSARYEEMSMTNSGKRAAESECIRQVRQLRPCEAKFFVGAHGD